MYYRFGSMEFNIKDEYVQGLIHFGFLCIAGVITAVSLFFGSFITSNKLLWFLFAPVSAANVVAWLPSRFGAPNFVVLGLGVIVVLFGWYSLVTLLASLKLKLSWRTRCICWTGLVLTWALPWLGLIRFSVEIR